MNDEGDASLPTLEHARHLVARGALLTGDVDGTVEIAQRFLVREPLESRKLAAISFAADVLRRESWEEEVELAPALFDRFPDAAPEPRDFRCSRFDVPRMTWTPLERRQAREKARGFCSSTTRAALFARSGVDSRGLQRRT